MEVPDYRCYVLPTSTRKFLTLTTYPSVLGLVSLLIVGFFGPERIDYGYYILAIGIGGIVIGVPPALVTYFLKRVKVTIRGNDKFLEIEVYDPKTDSTIRVAHPFTAKMQYTEGMVGKGASMRMLYYTLYDSKGYPQITFVSSEGAMHAPPHNSEPVDEWINGELRSKKLINAPFMYDTGKAPEIQSELNMRLRYIERRLKREADARSAN